MCAARTASPVGLWARLNKALEALSKPDLRADLERYLAQPASGLFHALQDGRADYHIFHLRRPEGRSGEVCHEVAAHLTGRSARLDKLEDPVAPASPAADWFPFTKPDATTGRNVFALPYAGGGASVYPQWRLPQRDNGPGWQVCSLQLPGRETRLTETAITEMDVMVDHIVAAIAPYTHLPWALIGCSLGCKIAFEVARRFEHMGQKPALLLLMACPAPSLPLKRRVSAYNDHDFAREVRHLGGTPAEIMADAEMMRAIMPILRSDSALAEGYTASPNDQVLSLFATAKLNGIDPVRWLAIWHISRRAPTVRSTRCCHSRTIPSAEHAVQVGRLAAYNLYCFFIQYCIANFADAKKVVRADAGPLQSHFWRTKGTITAVKFAIIGVRNVTMPCPR